MIAKNCLGVFLLKNKRCFLYKLFLKSVPFRSYTIKKESIKFQLLLYISQIWRNNIRRRMIFSHLLPKIGWKLQLLLRYYKMFAFCDVTSMKDILFQKKFISKDAFIFFCLLRIRFSIFFPMSLLKHPVLYIYKYIYSILYSYNYMIHRNSDTTFILGCQRISSSSFGRLTRQFLSKCGQNYQYLRNYKRTVIFSRNHLISRSPPWPSS